MSIYRKYLFVQLIVVLMVMGLFRLFERNTASIVASAIFVIVNFGILWVEGFVFKRPKTFSFIGTLIYTLFFVLPIAALRLIYGGIPLTEIQLGPINGMQLHQASNMGFLLLLVCYFWDLRQDKLKKD